MGIKHFFTWFKKKYPANLLHLYKGETIQDLNTRMEEKIEKIEIDNLLIDMNGIFHNSAQKIYEYGQFKPIKSLLRNAPAFSSAGEVEKRRKCFEEICRNIDKILDIVKPTKRVILCVDGPAPLSKQTQQRQRRFLSAREQEKSEQENKTTGFDSNCLTPGTVFMDYLSRYIDFHIKKSMSDSDSYWSKIDVVFSNEKAPGEGEHKLLNYIRLHGYAEDSYCMYGADADLIMLGLCTQNPKFYILRDEPMSADFEYYFISLGSLRKNIITSMKWASKKHTFKSSSVINDFILMCFLVGNDFLPHLPSIEIIEGGIDYLMTTYKETCTSQGHLTKVDYKTKTAIFNKKSVAAFMLGLSKLERKILQNKLGHRDNFFKDELLEKNSTISDEKIVVDIKGYRKAYYAQNFSSEIELKKICHDYLEGIQWVLQYYMFGVPNWRWKYPYHYAPFAYTIAKHVESFDFTVFQESKPILPFVQLLSVLPPRSTRLIPYPLASILTTSPMNKYCPMDFKVDLAGKRQEWEGTALLPFVNLEEIEHEYSTKIRDVHIKHRKRNIIGKSFFYTNTLGKSYQHTCFYGEFLCNVQAYRIDV